MANEKISTYAVSVSALASGDLLDVSKHLGAGVYQSQKLDYSTLLTELTADMVLNGGSGTANFAARWTALHTLDIGVIRDNATTAGIGALDASYLWNVETTTLFAAMRGLNTRSSGGSSIGVLGQASGNNSGGDNYGVWGVGNGSTSGRNAGVLGQFGAVTLAAISTFLTSATDGTGGLFQGAKATGTTYGVVGAAMANSNQAGATYVGGYFHAENAGTKYSLKLVDGTEGAGKFLTSMTSGGLANWQTINDFTADATPDANADYILTYDASAGVHKKSLLLNAAPNIGSFDLTSSANTRVFSLNGNTSASFFNVSTLAGDKIGSFRGDRRAMFIGSTFDSNSDFQIGDASTPVDNIFTYINATHTIRWYDTDNANSRMELVNGAFSVYGVADPTRYVRATNGILSINHPAQAFAITHSTTGQLVIEGDARGSLMVATSAAGVIRAQFTANTGIWPNNYLLDDLSVGVATSAARLHSKGIGATSATLNGLFEDSAGLDVIKMRDDGYVIQRAINAAIASGDLAASQLSWYIDETGNTAIIKVKYADGTTVKTGTIALV